MGPTRLFLIALASTATALYINGSVVAPCDSPIYCHGEILRQIELARPFQDSKTFVDLPTIRPLEEVIAAFNDLPKPLSNNTELQEFLTTYFGEAGSEIAPVPEDELSTNATFLDHVNDTVVRDFVAAVVDIWPNLTRSYVGASNCSGCVDSFIPLNRTFVVAGGRFREPYYWDSFWIIEGLLRTQGSFTEIALNIIENFLDLVRDIGFVPNGARQYYLNRSQPPLLTQMLSVYMDYVGNDTSILERALPILEQEYAFWTRNRSVTVETPNGAYTLNHYAVENTQPRPESYREDYITANNRSYYAESGIIYPENNPLNETERAELYANLASGAESGWDYSSRWLRTPADAANDVYFPLRSLNVINTVPVDLNSILYMNEISLATYSSMVGNESAAAHYNELAANRSAAMYALMWNSTYNSYFDYNLTSSSQNRYTVADADATPSEASGAPPGYQVAFSAAQYYPFWTGAAPAQLKNNPLAVRLAYQRVQDQLEQKAGGISATNLITGEQWDQPNVWPPLMYILIDGLLNTPPTFGADDPDYVTTQQLALDLAQRYLDSTFCTWRQSGGATPGLERVEGVRGEGIMFEKYADNDTSSAGGGGEYEVVEGFGWTNGVLIWVADLFGANLTQPDCGNLAPVNSTLEEKKKRKSRRSALELHPADARFVKKWAK